MSAIRVGYKQTEVGVIPEDWTPCPLGEVVTFLDGKRRPVKDSDRAKMRGAIPYYGASGIVDYVNDYLFDDDLILLGEDGENIVSRNCRLAFRISGKAWVNNHAHVLKPNPGISIGFLTDYLESLNYERFNSGTAQPKLNKQTCFAIPVALPPTNAEQEAIAEALSDADALIESLEQLLAKKRHLKQGSMQGLLTGKKRLPGFYGEWALRTLDSVVDALEAGVSVNSLDSLPHTGQPSILKTSAIADGKFLPIECKAIAPFDISRARANPRRDTILISRMNTPDLVGEVGYVDDNYPWLFLPDRIWITRFRVDSEICVRWLAYLLSSSKYKQLIQGAATGTSGSMKNISKPVLMALPVRFPSYLEQAAIATVLSDIDTEIATLESQLTKTRALKQGMMQKLFTGEIRLI